MQRSVELPGTWFETWYMNPPASLSSTNTVPAANELPEFVVVLENAEIVPNPARALAAPIRRSESRIFRCFAVIAVDSFGRSRIDGVYRHKHTFGAETGRDLPRSDVPRSPERGSSLSNLARVGEREWWLRAALV